MFIYIFSFDFYHKLTTICLLNFTKKYTKGFLMDFLQTFILAIVQGITEFLPISSSAHLILTSQFLGWKDQGVTFDLALNVGTLLAVVVYFRKDVWEIIRDTLSSLVQRKKVGTSSLGWFIAFATIPAGLFGLFLMDIVDTR